MHIVKPGEVIQYISPPQMNKFAAYLKEREGVELLETDDGFAIFNIKGEECYIRDIYVWPELRQKGIASRLADEISSIAKLAGCKILTGSVCPTLKGSTTSIDVLRGYGFKLHSATNNLIFFSKDL